MPPKTFKVISVGLLKDLLEGYPDHYEIDFSGLEFNRLKQRGPELVQVEFMEQVFRDRKTGLVVVQNLE